MSIWWISKDRRWMCIFNKEKWVTELFTFMSGGKTGAKNRDWRGWGTLASYWLLVFIHFRQWLLIHSHGDSKNWILTEDLFLDGKYYKMLKFTESFKVILWASNFSSAFKYWIWWPAYKNYSQYYNLLHSFYSWPLIWWTHNLEEMNEAENT